MGAGATLGPRRNGGGGSVAPGASGLGASDPCLLRERSALGELLGVDFETMGAMQLYRASDALMKHREAIESHLFGQAIGLEPGHVVRSDEHLLRG